MTYRKSYYEQRMEENAKIRDAVLKTIASETAEEQPKPVAEKVSEAIAEVVEKPSSSWPKIKLQEWLTANGIEFTNSMSKKQLLKLV